MWQPIRDALGIKVISVDLNKFNRLKLGGLFRVRVREDLRVRKLSVLFTHDVARNLFYVPGRNVG